MIVFDMDKKEILVYGNTITSTKAGTGIKIIGAEDWRCEIRDNVILPPARK